MVAILETTETKINPDEKICFRFLEPDEYYKLECVFNEYEDRIPKPGLSRIAIAEMESTGEIIGFFVCQLKSHAEPMWIHPDHRNGKLWVRLAAMIDPITRRGDTYIIASRPEIERMCEALQLKKVTYSVYVREYIPEEEISEEEIREVE